MRQTDHGDRIFYAIYLMECDDFYSSHPPYEGVGDSCSRTEIAAGTATQYSILGMTTTFCGTLNLFIAGWTVKKVGARLALMIQVLVPAIRVAAQILGVMAGGATGITIIQCTQLITIIGGPAGYMWESLASRHRVGPYMLIFILAVSSSTSSRESSLRLLDVQLYLACCRDALCWAKELVT